MPFLALRAYLALIQIEVHLGNSNFGALHRKVRNYPVAKSTSACDTVEKVCAAVDISCIWYWRQVLCLQRSAVTTLLLRRSGMPARMIIGGQQMPFKAHAWVEVEGRVVNDKPYMREMYSVLDQW
jgi:Transglutaminase-like superfamily